MQEETLRRARRIIAAAIERFRELLSESRPCTKKLVYRVRESVTQSPSRKNELLIMQLCKVLIKLAATWEGIAAMAELEKEATM